MQSRSSSASTSPARGPFSASALDPPGGPCCWQQHGLPFGPSRVSSVTDEIKQRIDLVELIGHSVKLRRVGSSYVGLCPFHTEKTPSFHVRPQAGTWHCFGCNKGGSAFDWLTEREQLEFSEALRVLA